MDATTVWRLIGSVFALLLAGNLYFLNKLITKVEGVGAMQTTVALVNERINSILNQIKEITTDLKELRKMEIEVAVIREQLNPANGYDS